MSATITMPLPDVMLLIHWLVIKLLVAVVSIVAFIAAMDFLYVKFKHLRDRRMSRQDIKDEINRARAIRMCGNACAKFLTTARNRA